MTLSHQDNRLRAILYLLGGVGLASSQDAITKAMSGNFPAYEIVMFRCIGSLPLLAILLWREGGFGLLATPLLGRVVLRGVILCSGYFAFVLSLAAMPMANAVAIYFTMPFFVAGLAGPLLAEKVRIHRWLAIITGFIGVLIMVRPGLGVFEPAALLALASAFFYGLGQTLGRPIAQQVPQAVIAMWQNLIYFSAGLAFAIVFNSGDFSFFTHKSLVFLSRPWVWPDMHDALILGGSGLLAAIGMVLFISAYKYGESNFVAPFEYSAMIWAVIYGLLIFHDIPDAFTLTGAAVVVMAGIVMVWCDRQLDRAMGQSP